MEFRISLDDDITSSVNSLAALFDLALENGDEVLQYCYDHYDDFLVWLNSVDNNRAKILSACQRQIGDYGLEYFSFVLKSKAKTVALIEKKWEKDHPPRKEIKYILKPDKTEAASNRKFDSVCVRPQTFPRKEISVSNWESHESDHAIVQKRNESSLSIPFSIPDGRVLLKFGDEIIVKGMCYGEVEERMSVKVVSLGVNRVFTGEILEILNEGCYISKASLDRGEVALQIKLSVAMHSLMRSFKNGKKVSVFKY